MADLTLSDYKMALASKNHLREGAKKVIRRGLHGFESPVFLFVDHYLDQVVEYEESGRKNLTIPFASIKKIQCFKYQGNRVEIVRLRNGCRVKHLNHASCPLCAFELGLRQICGFG